MSLACSTRLAILYVWASIRHPVRPGHTLSQVLGRMLVKGLICIMPRTLAQVHVIRMHSMNV
jgi:hypothetical protein